MLLRSTFGILAFAALLASASASVVTYRVTGTFDQATDDYEPLLGTQFTYDFSYDSETPNVGNEYSAVYELISTDLKTSLGDLHTFVGNDYGYGSAIVDIDPDYGSLTFGAYAMDEYMNQHAYGLEYSDLDPQKGDLPSDLAAFAGDHKGSFFITGFGPPRFQGVGSASASTFSVQAVPEPATIAAVAVSALAVLRRRRKAA